MGRLNKSVSFNTDLRPPIGYATNRKRGCRSEADRPTPSARGGREPPSLEARHSSADEVLYLAQENLGSARCGIAKLLQIVTRQWTLPLPP
jgi:hypothetical protein